MWPCRKAGLYMKKHLVKRLPGEYYEDPQFGGHFSATALVDRVLG